MHTKTRSIFPSGRSAMSATVCTPSTSSPFRLVPYTPPAYPAASRLCRETNPNFPGWVEAPATRTPFGSNSARNCLPLGLGRGSMAAASSTPPSSTRPSTATSSPDGCTMRGLMSTLATSGRSSASRPRPTSSATSWPRSTACSPRNSPSSFCVERLSIISPAVTSSSGAGRNTTSAIASARIPPRPSMTVGPNCGSRTTPAMNSRLPAIIGAIRTLTSPSACSTRLRSSAAAASTATRSARRNLTNPRSVLCAIVSPLSLATTG